MRKENHKQRLERRVAQLEKELKEAREIIVLKNAGNVKLLAEKADLAARLEELESACGVRYFSPAKQVEA
jgi:hypothetical protein